MRRLDPPPSPDRALDALERMMEEQLGLRLLLDHLPPGSTLADARRLHERLAQMTRRPCSFLDRELGIVRDD